MHTSGGKWLYASAAVELLIIAVGHTMTDINEQKSISKGFCIKFSDYLYIRKTLIPKRYVERKIKKESQNLYLHLKLWICLVIRMEHKWKFKPKCHNFSLVIPSCVVKFDSDELVTFWNITP